MAANAAAPNFIVVPLPIQLLNRYLPWGSWGVSYDVSTNETEFDLPDGWNSRRSTLRHFLTKIV